MVKLKGKVNKSSSNSTGAISGEARLAWSAPTTNTDTSPLTDLAGYRVYIGAAPSSYSESFDVGNVTEYDFDSLPAGTYYFSVRAYDNVGNLGPYGVEVSKVIN